MNNIILNTDSYKLSHYLQYPPKAEYATAYVESRGGTKRSILFGPQAYAIEYLIGTRVTPQFIKEAREVAIAHGLPFNEAGWRHILKEHKGHLPIEIQAVPEGTLVNANNVLVQIRNTDPKVPWLTSYLETSLLRAIWYPTTVATNSFEIRQMFENYYRNAATAGWKDQILFKLHDFGARGATSEESAGLGGLAHLLSFRGTDTLSAITAGWKYYKEPMAGFSIPAAEHSTITAWGREGEQKAFDNMIEQFAGEGKIYAVVSDSYSITNAVEKIWGENLRLKVKSRKGTLVVRPDSGDPVRQVLFCLETLGEKFGYYRNTRNMKVLNDSVRVIQGDGVNPKSIEEILQVMIAHQWSPENVAFGMGGALLQKVDRDTQKFAMKTNEIVIDGKARDVFKEPEGEAWKSSKKGRLALVKDGYNFKTIREDELGNEKNELRTIFKNGKLLIEEPLSVIRARVEKAFMG